MKRTVRRSFEVILQEIHSEGFSIQNMYELREDYWSILVARTDKRSVSGYASDYGVIETLEDALAKARIAWEKFLLKPQETPKKITAPYSFNVDDLGI